MQETFEYTVYGVKWKVQVDSTMLNFESRFSSKTILRSALKGIGVGTMGSVGTTIGMEINQNVAPEELDKTADLQSIPKAGTMLVIGYNETPDKVKAYNVPLDPQDQVCIKLIKKIKEQFPSLYLGIGPTIKVQKAMGISMLMNMIIFWLILAFIIGGVVLYQFRHAFNSYL